jgi:hypothetical protein
VTTLAGAVHCLRSAIYLWFTQRVVKLITAHKILIFSAVVFFTFFALWELRGYSNSGESWAVFRSLLYLLVSLGFGIYLKNLKHWYK